MILKTLWIQRECSYKGQHAPECIFATDEFSIENNPDWFENEVDNQVEELGHDIIAHKVIDIEIDQNKIIEILNINPKIRGKIK